jgi:RNA polymerase sigma-70 factor (ECF subfamily)
MAKVASLTSIVAEKRPALLREGLDEALQAFIHSAQQALPEVALDPALFVAHVAERLPEAGDAAGALAKLQAPDLYLACACVQGVPQALAIFEREHLARARLFITRVDTGRDFVNEVIQRLGERLLVGPEPRIGQYGGTGPLGAWVRVAATRLALNVRRDGQRADKIRSGEPVGEAVDVEADFINGQYRGQIESAFRIAFTHLSDGERTVLRLHYVERMDTPAIARRQKINRSTASRRLAAARRHLLDETHRELERVLPALTTLSRDSLIRAVRSQIDLNLSSVLASRR